MTLEYELGYLLGKEAARTGESEASLKERLGELLAATSNGSQAKPSSAAIERYKRRSMGNRRSKYFVEGGNLGTEPPKWHKKVLELNDKEWTPQEIAEKVGHSVATVYFVFKKYGTVRKAPKHPGVKLG